MDITARNAYVHVMFGRLVTMLAMLAIAVVTTMTPAHEARMSAGLDHAVHVNEMMHVTDNGERSCTDQLHCGAAETSMCAFVCAGLSAFLTSAGGEAGHAHGTASHDVPSEAIHVSRVPRLNERPPKLRLL